MEDLIAKIQTVILLVIISQSSWAQQISCGDRPKIEQSTEEKLKSDVEVKAQLLTRKIGEANVEGSINASKNELYQDHSDVGKDEINEYFAWVSCQVISQEKNITAADKIALWEATYRTFQGQSVAATDIKLPAAARSENELSIFIAEGLKFSVKHLIKPSSNHVVTLIITATNINSASVLIALSIPAPTLTDDSGNAGVFLKSEGIQFCFEDDIPCSRDRSRLFQLEPNSPANLVFRYKWPEDADNFGAASFSSRVLLIKSTAPDKLISISPAIPDIVPR